MHIDVNTYITKSSLHVRILNFLKVEILFLILPFTMTKLYINKKNFFDYYLDLI